MRIVGHTRCFMPFRQGRVRVRVRVRVSLRVRVRVSGRVRVRVRGRVRVRVRVRAIPHAPLEDVRLAPTPRPPLPLGHPYP